jgi:aspartate kinase
LAFEKVMKFGGAALADGPAVERVCAIVREHGGDRPVVVVSAHQGVTSLLDATAREAAEGRVDGDRVRIRHRSLLRQLGLDAELLNRYFAEIASLLGELARRRRLLPEERDLILSYGERMSARVVAHALNRGGVAATPVDAFDLGLTTDSNHGAARPLPESRLALRAALLEVPGVPVVTGFLAKDRHGNLTTLGRNGSDLTAALVAEAVGAEGLELWKAVGGMMTADPAIVPGARVLERLSFEDAAALAQHGAEVLHPEAIAPAARAGIAVRFLDVRNPRGKGTLLEPGPAAPGPVGISSRRRLARVELPAPAHPRLEAVACLSDGDRVRAYYPGVSAAEAGFALAAVVGRAPGDPELARRILEILAKVGVRVLDAALGAERSTQLLVVAEEDLERAVCALHEALFAPAQARVP